MRQQLGFGLDCEREGAFQSGDDTAVKMLALAPW
jgi:hypothetical protein